MKIAIIPARGNSKRIRKKNLKKFYNKPIIQWTIEKLKKSKLFDLIIVSSEDNKILKISKKLKCDLTIKRPKKLSGDDVTTIAVIKHAIKKINIEKKINISVCCVYPCNPLLHIKDLKFALSCLHKHKEKFIFSATDFSPQFDAAFEIDKNNNVISKNTESVEKNKKNKLFYHDAGQFYWGFVKTWLKYNNIHKNSRIIEIPNWRVVDINTQNDWNKAKALFKFIRFNKNDF